ncbi:MAG: glycosyltransferase family 4 protein [Betaproteobacteria bacterium]
MTLLYAFPEPLPLDRARGVQVAHTVADLAQLDVPVELTYVPVPSLHPLAFYGLAAPEGLTLTPLSRSLPWPLERVHSNRLFLMRLAGRIEASPGAILFVRHLKLAAMLLKRYPGRKLVYEAHEVFSDTGTTARRSANLEMEALVMHKAALVLANSAATAERLGELHGGRRIEVLVNGVDWPEQLSKKDWPHACMNIVYAGSLFGWKGVEDLVAAAATLPGCRITVIGGSAPQVERLRVQAPSDGAQLEFRGQLSHAEVAVALQSACIAVLPNRDTPDSRFTSPIKLFEYMAAGCAVVASDLPALRDVLSEDEAVWVRAGDPAALAAGIGALTADPERARRIGGKLREKARAHTWRARAEKLAALLASLDSSS